MTLLRCQVELSRDNNLPEDAVVNTWYFWSGSMADPVDLGEMATLSSRFEDFYDDIHSYLSSVLSGIVTVSIYDMGQSEPRVPVFTRTISAFTASSTQSLPSEVALCLSFQGAPASGINQARRRGRIYLGPLNINALATSPIELGGDVRPVPSIYTAIFGAYDALEAAANALGYIHVVFSPTTLGSGTNYAAALATVTSQWVDNAFDTQRRRGAAPSARVFNT